MAFIVQTKPDIGDATRQEDVSTLIDNVNDLNSRVANTESGKSELINGSFEIFDDENQPNGWEVTVAAGNSGGVVTSGVRHGAYSYKASNTAGALGGVELATEDFIPVGQDDTLALQMYAKVTASGSLNTGAINYYQYDKATLVSSNTFFAYSGVALDWTEYIYTSAVPSGARFCKLDFNLVNNATISDAYLDGLKLEANPTIPEQIIISGNTNYAVPSYIQEVTAELVGGGGGGGAGAQASVVCGTGGGGGAGGHKKVVLKGIGGQTLALVVGTGGAGGTSGGAGANGNNTTLTVSGVTYTAYAGSAGAGNAGAGGAGGAATTGNPNELGVAGKAGAGGLSSSTYSVWGSFGGSSFYGEPPLQTQGAANSSTGWGAGGNGAGGVPTNSGYVNGGAGAKGIVILRDFK